MDGRGFDELTRTLAGGRSRRTVLKGLLGLGGGAVAAAVSRPGAEAAWSTLVCLPNGNDGYIQRLVPTAAVPFYIQRYGAKLPENGSCHVCTPISVEDACGAQCSGTSGRGCGMTADCGPEICGNHYGGICTQSVTGGDAFCESELSCIIPEVECETDDDCHQARCDTDLGVCVQCFSHSDCELFTGGYCVTVPESLGCSQNVACTWPGDIQS